MPEDLPQIVYTCDQVRKLDAAAIDSGIPGIVLMKRAGRAVFDLICQRWPKPDQIIVLCGGGNNGGDGYIIGGLAAQAKVQVKAYALVQPSKLSGDAKTAYQFALAQGLNVETDFDPQCLQSNSNEEKTLVVDAVFGSGFRGALKEPLSKIFAQVNRAGLPVVAVDIPSGLEGDTGAAASEAIKACFTVSFIGLKRGLFTGSGPELCGDVVFDALGVPDSIYETVEGAGEDKPAIKVRNVSARIGRRRNSHKGTHGHVLVIGGDLGMGGAGILAAESALLSGAGMVSLATRPEHVTAALARLPEIMTRGISSGIELSDIVKRADTIVIGPGLGQSAWSQQMLYFALSENAKKKVPSNLVVDADGLNLIAKNKDQYDVSGAIITPHPGEASRLLGVLVADIQSDRFNAVIELNKNYGAISVLKGAGTLIKANDELFVADAGSPAMAVAGMGDILAGVIGAMLARGLPRIDAAAQGVLVHALAGELAERTHGELGVRASDMPVFIRQIINGLPEA